MAFWIFALLALTGAVASAPSRIVGGNPASIDNYPSLVQVELQNQFNFIWSQYCGGTIITARSVLSAARCFVGPNYSPEFRRVRAGATYRGAGGVINYVLEVYNHPSYDVRISHDGDISVVRLTTAFIFSPTVARASIPIQGSVVPHGLPVFYAGWGARHISGSPSPVLQDVRVFSISKEVCSDIYKGVPSQYGFTENMICAGTLGVSGNDACERDYGGPVYYGNMTIGVVSFRLRCGLADFPGLNTAVASYTNWIIEKAV